MLCRHGVDSAWLHGRRRCSAPRAASPRGRRDQPAHPRRLLHHDHARLRADGLLPGALAARPAATTGLTLSGGRSLGLPRLDRRRDVLLRGAGGPAGALPACAACSTRASAACSRGSARTRRAWRRSAFATYRFKLLVFVIAGAAAGLAGGAARQPERVRRAQPAALDPVRPADGHGDPRRRRPAVRRRARRGRAAGRRGGAGRAHDPLAARLGVVLLAVVLCAPQGLAGLARRWRPRA